jgi:hypothetical protein
MRRIGLRKCPYCGSSQVYVSAPKALWEKVSSVFLLRFVRCHGCMRRHFRPLLLPAAKHPGAYAMRAKPAETVSTRKSEKRSA